MPILTLDKDTWYKCWLTDDPKPPKTEQGRFHATLKIVIKRDERKEESKREYFTMLVWGRLGQNVIDYGLKKGDALMIKGGRLKQVRYDDKEKGGYCRDVQIDLSEEYGHAIDFTVSIKQ